jgi:S-DNA-T family DNA segregation ATPase FtsK/SpoIIIE
MADTHSSRRAAAPRRRSGSRAAQRSQGVPDILTVGRLVARARVAGTLLLLLAVLAVPGVIALPDPLLDVRAALLRALGVHAATVALLLGATGVLLLLGGRGPRARALLWQRRRHVLGAAVMLAFSAGLLGLWSPDITLDGVDLASASAGGGLGRALTSWPSALGWLLALPAGFALLWPRTAARGARATPPALAVAASRVWRLRLDRRAWQGARALGRASSRLPAQLTALASALMPRLPEERRRATGPTTIDDLAGPPELSLLAVPHAPTPRAEELAPPDEEEDAPSATQIQMDMERPAEEWRHSEDGWQLPALSLLQAGADPTRSATDNARRAELIVETLASFGVDSSVVQVNEGPTVTQFGVEPGWDVRTRSVVERDAQGQTLLDDAGQPRTRRIETARTRIRVSRITALQNDLALALAAPSLRIEAPVPGKPIVGIEVPNHSASVVSLRSVLESPTFAKARTKSALPVALGVGVSGEPIVADLATMPHLLIAGATGSGKSVCLSGIITSLLMNYSPQELRLVLIDPKRVELTPFADVPHLAFSEIVVDMERVVGTLQAVINEMESRYRRFAKAGVRNVARYNEQNPGRSLPYWVVVVDELADLMMAAPFQVEAQLVRLAQLARATGIHLVVATQRPSVDVITGLIKANFPTRIAFAVASQVDSRTVLDHGGAEKLLGRGDMLFQAPDAQKPMRLQGVYVADGEIEDVAEFWTADRFASLAPEKHDDLLRDAERQVTEELEAGGPGGGIEPDDPMLARATALLREHERVSTSLLQRKLRIGYPRAARLMDELEQRGLVAGSESGGSSRAVLLDAGAGAAAPEAAAAPAPPPPSSPPPAERHPALVEQDARYPSFPRPFDAD